MMSIRIYNTINKKKETFVPIEANKVKMYVCGPTVYDACHVGHARSAVVFDVIARYMEASGYDVMIYCRNDLLTLWKLENYSKYPYWVARYYDLKGSYNPETNQPSAPTAWKNGWQAWQFTPAGIISGVRGGVDVNVMKKAFINKFV